MNIQDKNEVRQLIKEACKELNYGKLILDTPEAIELLLGTWACESNGGKYLKQLGGGPALSAWQIEKPTFCDTIKRCRIFHKSILGQTANYSDAIYDSDFYRIELNHKLAIQVARLKYFLSPLVIPKDLEGQAMIWKKVYNTYLGAGTVEKYLQKYKFYAL
jgi:hypothetical protein